MISVVDPFAVSIPAIIHRQAEQFAAQQSTPKQGVRVYLNTLAIWAVHHYLHLLHISTDLGQSDGWQPSLQVLLTSADLLLTGRGRLECGVFQPGQTEITIPLAAQMDRLGFVGVRVGDRLDQVELIGFLPAEPELPARVNIHSLRSLDELLSICSTTPVTRLAAWLQQEFDHSWQVLEDVVRSREPAFALRRNTTIQRAKSFGPVVLALSINSVPDDPTVHLGLQLYPSSECDTLPTDLSLKVLTATGEVFRELQPQPGDTTLLYRFEANPAEQFAVQLNYGGGIYNETFVV